jgi:hypothetical protein
VRGTSAQAHGCKRRGFGFVIELFIDELGRDGVNKPSVGGFL